MTDFADHAQALEMAFTEASITNTLNRGKKLSVDGSCHYCGDKVDGRLFCDVDCLKDYEYEEEIKRKQGLK